MTVIARLVRPAELAAVKAYADTARLGEPSLADLLVVAENDARFVGLVRLSHERGELILHGLQADHPEAPALLMQDASRWIAHQACWALAQAVDTALLAEHGFIEPSITCPEFLLELKASRETGDCALQILHRAAK
ncbi:MULTISPECIES: hypothetical protein [Deefgea]|uniref:hypothetical protein n=1 Tax=Deefgea TaxID=400947 RepID=UPI0015F596B4|nr:MULTISPECIES: hypothetical protein [Deefgea]MBM5574525.1 hypothetical protein [Deefgea sp. CFH1-16]QZA81641.1 hypothetical protein K4H25_02960 [Deefgea piscis]